MSASIPPIFRRALRPAFCLFYAAKCRQYSARYLLQLTLPVYSLYCLESAAAYFLNSACFPLLNSASIPPDLPRLTTASIFPFSAVKYCQYFPCFLLLYGHTLPPLHTASIPHGFPPLNTASILPGFHPLHSARIPHGFRRFIPKASLCSVRDFTTTYCR